MLKNKAGLVGVALAIALVAAPLSPAAARGRHFAPFFPFAVAGAVVAGVAALVTAPVVLATAPFRAPAYYYAPPAAYYPAPPAAYYPPPPAAYYPPAPAYYPPPAAYYPAPPAYPAPYPPG